MQNTFRGSKNYVASPELMNAVNIAVALKKPLLIKGEPGTGKTMLAQAVSEALGKKLIIWSVKSTTKAQDGLYVYDVVQRLYDSQFGSAGVDDIAKYIKLGKLGEAFSSDEQVVLLIDEVERSAVGAGQDGILHSGDEGNGEGEAPSHRDHHFKRGEGAAGCFPAPLYLSLYRIPGSGADGADHPRSL